MMPSLIYKGLVLVYILILRNGECAPLFLDTSNIVTADLHSEIMLPCGTVKASSLRQIVWNLNGTTIKDSGESHEGPAAKYEITVFGSEDQTVALKISDVHMSDSGIYKCFLKSLSVVESYSVKLQVRLPEKPTTEGPRNAAATKTMGILINLLIILLSKLL